MLSCCRADEESERRPCLKRKLPDVVYDAEGNSKDFEFCESGGKVVLKRLSKRARDALKGVGEDDPAVLLMWDIVHVNDAVANLNAAAGAGAVTPAWLGGGPFPITATQLTQSIVNHLGTVGGGVVGNALIAPNTLDQFANVRELAAILGLDALLMTIPAAALPLARAYTLADRKAQTTASPCPVLAPPGGAHAIA